MLRHVLGVVDRNARHQRPPDVEGQPVQYQPVVGLLQNACVDELPLGEFDFSSAVDGQLPFEITDPTREALTAWLKLRGDRRDDWLFPAGAAQAITSPPVSTGG